MPFFERDNIKIYYEESGQGFPVLLFAPGGMRSAIKYWHESEFKAIEELKELEEATKPRARMKKARRRNGSWRCLAGCVR